MKRFLIYPSKDYKPGGSAVASPAWCVSTNKLPSHQCQLLTVSNVGVNRTVQIIRTSLILHAVLKKGRFYCTGFLERFDVWLLFSSSSLCSFPLPTGQGCSVICADPNLWSLHMRLLSTAGSFMMGEISLWSETLIYFLMPYSITGCSVRPRSHPA